MPERAHLGCRIEIPPVFRKNCRSAQTEGCTKYRSILPLVFISLSVLIKKLISLFDRVGLGGWLSAQKDGLDTICDRSSMGLSKGQMMRFSLLGNLIRDRKIYLVDEIEDGVDAESRKKVFSLLKDLAEERLVVVVSHTALFDDEGTIIRLPST